MQWHSGREVLITAILVIGGAVVLAVLAVVLVYFNRLVRLRNKAGSAWHQIDVQLNRRYDLVPRLAEVVSGYAGYERDTLEEVAAARSRALGAAGMAEQGSAENGLSAALGGVLVLQERYPDLKADGEFLKFQKELSSTETRIAGSRKYYNGAVMQYENARQAFPGNLVARLFRGRFEPMDYFELHERHLRLPPEVRVEE